MNLLALVFAVSTASASQQPAVAGQEARAVASCTAQRLTKFVGPFGIHQPWPIVASLPQRYAGRMGELLSDQGAVADGYMQTLHVDAVAKAAYVVQQGGFAGTQTIHGPLPVSDCVANAPQHKRQSSWPFPFALAENAMPPRARAQHVCARPQPARLSPYCRVTATVGMAARRNSGISPFGRTT